MRNFGFTLVEMLIVVSVIGILALLAAPWYADRIVREQIKEALPLADIAKKPIAASWSQAASFPADNAAAGLPAAQKIVANFVSSLSVVDGTIQLTFGNRASGAIAGKILSLRPAVVEDEPIVPIAWVCGHAEAPGGMKSHGQDLTNIPDVLLPVDCRASSH